MAERPKTPPLISPPAPEFTELIGIKRHKPSTELERHFDEGLRTGKKEDLYLMLERIKCLIETIDQSYQHHEIPGHDLPWEGRFRRFRYKNGIPCLEMYRSTILAEKEIGEASYPWLTLPRLPRTDRLHKVDLGGHPHFHHIASPEDHWVFLGEKEQILSGWSEVVRTSWQLVHGPGVTQIVQVDFYNRK